MEEDTKMAKRKKDKNAKINKHTVKLIKTIDEALKKKVGSDGIYKVKKGYKHKKKTKRAIKYTCPHWHYVRDDSKGGAKKIVPAIDIIPGNADMMRCKVCGAVFPTVLKPNNPDTPKYGPYHDEVMSMLGKVNTVLFYSVRFGGGSEEDAQTFFRLRKGLVQFDKISKNVAKAHMKRQQIANEQQESRSDYNNYGGFNYA